MIPGDLFDNLIAHTNTYGASSADNSSGNSVEASVADPVLGRERSHLVSGCTSLGGRPSVHAPLAHFWFGSNIRYDDQCSVICRAAGRPEKLTEQPRPGRQLAGFPDKKAKRRVDGSKA